MTKLFSIAAILFLATLTPSCSKESATEPAGPRATVFLRDGTSYSGAVKKTSPTEITLAGDDNSSRTFDMRSVKSIEYGESAAALPPPPPQTAPPAPSSCVAVSLTLW